LTWFRKISSTGRPFSTIPKQQHFTISRHVSPRGGFLFHATLRFSELARVLVRFDHIARFIVNANHGIV
jgi:hypothetical protein